VNQDLILGVAAGYEQVDMSTAINSGSYHSKMAMVAPYAAVRLTNWLLLDATVAYGAVHKNLDRLDPATMTQVFGQTNANNWFGSANLTASLPTVVPAWRVEGIFGYTAGSSVTASYVETGGAVVPGDRVTTSEAYIGPRATYKIEVAGGSIEPYVSARLQYEFQPFLSVLPNGLIVPISNRVDGLVSAGTRFASMYNWSGNIDFSTLVGQGDVHVYTTTLSLRYQF
jgi:outer membrane autotransporter protein